MNKGDILIVCALKQEVNGELDDYLPDPRQILYKIVWVVIVMYMIWKLTH